MLQVYRITRSRYKDDLTGEGARLMGGRWNHVLTPCVYTASTRSLALLEFAANTQSGNVPDDLLMMTIDVWVEEIMELWDESLPTDWRVHPAPNSTKDIGTSVLNETDVKVLAVPSVIVPQEYNYILNPANLLRGEAEISDVEPVDFDFRIKL